MFVTKDHDNKAFDYIDPYGGTLAYIAWSIRVSYHCTIMATPVKAVFDRYILFDLASFLDRQVVTAEKQHQVEIDNAKEKSRLVTYNYTIGNKVYVKMTSIYHEIYYNKQGPYRIT